MGFGIGRHDVPGCMVGIGSAYGCFVGFAVVVPVLPFFQICRLEFPVLVGIGDAFFQPCFLFFGRDMQKAFDDGSAGFMQHAFKIADMGKAAFALLVIYPVMHARDQHVFIMAAIEDHQFASRRHLLMHAPQEVMVFLL